MSTLPIAAATWRARHLAAILALCLAGAAVSGLLVRQHADPGATTGVFARVCGLMDGTHFSCAAAISGRFGEVAIPLLGTRVPTAFLGLAYFVALGTWFAVAGGPRPYGRRWHRLPRHLAFTGLAASALLTALMAAGLAPWCAWCAGVHAINLALVIAVARLTGREPEAPALLPRDPLDAARLAISSRHALTAIAIAMVLVGGLWMHRRAHAARFAERARLLPYRHQVEALQRDPDFLRREHVVEARHEIPLRPSELEADVPGQPRLVVFTDVECPACRCNALRLHQSILPRFGGRLSLSIRHFPQDAIHPDARDAACAAEAARLLGGEAAFEQMHALLSGNRDRLDRQLYGASAARIGLDAQRLLELMDSPAVRSIVAADAALAERLGVTGTPAMFLDGRRVSDLVDADAFWQALADAGPGPGPGPGPGGAQPPLATTPPQDRPDPEPARP